MSITIGIGTNLKISNSWSSYFSTRQPTGLTLTVISDTIIQLNWTSNSEGNEDYFLIERSTDGVTYTQIDQVGTGIITYNSTGLTTNTRYYYRIRARKGSAYSPYSNVDDDWTAALVPLAATGTGAGVATVRFWFDTIAVTVSLDGTGRFYSDAAGTLNESTSYTFPAGSLQTRYLKVTAGNSNMLVFAKGNWLRWGDIVSNGWDSGINAPTTSVVITTLPTSLTYLRVEGSNTISGSVAALTNLTYLLVIGSNTLSGSVTALTSLTFLRVDGSNTLSGSVAALTSLTYLLVTGSNTLSGSVAALTSLTYLFVTGSNTLSGSVAALTSLTYLLVLDSNTLSGSVAALTSLTFLRVEGSNTLSGSVAALTNLTYLRVTGSNTLSGSVAALTSLTYLRVTGSNTLSGDIGALNMVDGITYLSLDPCAMTTYTAGATWSNATVVINPSVGSGYDSTEVDNILIDMANSGTMNNKTIILMGSNAARTAASNAAVATLVAAGCTVNTNP